MSRESRPPAGLSRRSLLSNAAATTVVGALVGSGTVAAGSGSDADHSAEDVRLESHDGTELAATVFRPGGATADDPVPMILHSHGWSGSRTRRAGAFETELDRGFGVLSFDQRGHGGSGGKAHVQNPDLEGKDVMVILDHVADLEWVRRSVGDDGEPVPDDPMTFAVGGSYGGAYQLVGAFTELRERGATRFDALAPQITWHDLSESLAPQGVTRSTWMLVLYLAGFTMQPEHVHRGFLWGLATGQWPEGETPGIPDLDSEFHRNGPSGFVDDGYRLDIPVLFGQGIDDNLFNLNQGWKNLERALTDDARKRSALVGYNGGHALPNVLPPGSSTSGNACSEAGFAERRLRFFEAVRDGDDACDVVDARYELTTMDGSRCVRREVLDEHETVAVGDVECEAVEIDRPADAGFNAVADLTFEADTEAVVDEKGRELETRLESDGLLDDLLDGVLLDGGLLGDDPLEDAVGDLLEGDGTTLTTGVGVPKHLEIAAGPLTVAGIPRMSATVTTPAGEQRLFAALSVGKSRADATVVQNNVMPLREPEPVDDAEREIELPGVAVDVAEDETLFLTLSAVSDMSIAHGSRVPGIVTLEDVSVDLPVDGEPPEDCNCEDDESDGDGDEDDGGSDDGSDEDDGSGDDGSDGDDSDGGNGDDGTDGDDGDDSDGSGGDGNDGDDSDGNDDSGGGDSGGNDGSNDDSDGSDGSDDSGTGDDGSDGSDDDGSDETNGDDEGSDGNDGSDEDDSDGDGSDGDDDSNEDGSNENDPDGTDDSSKKKKKGKDEETGSGDGADESDGGSTDGTDTGSDDDSSGANESVETTSSESDGRDSGESDGDSSPGVGAIGALGTLGGLGYMLSRRLEAAADATPDDEAGPENNS